MKLPKNYFDNLTASKYREYLKLLPDMKKESNKAITMLIFTFLALSFLGVFAINPTFATIIALQKQLSDSTFVHQQLTTKMNNLSHLQQQYNNLTSDLPIVYNAIPQTAEVTHLVGQIQSLAKDTNVSITSLRVGQVQLASNKKPSTAGFSFFFTLEAQGAYDNMIHFAASLAHFNRIVTIESLGLTKDQKSNILTITVKGREYVKQ